MIFKTLTISFFLAIAALPPTGPVLLHPGQGRGAGSVVQTVLAVGPRGRSLRGRECRRARWGFKLMSREPERVPSADQGGAPILAVPVRGTRSVTGLRIVRFSG